MQVFAYTTTWTVYEDKNISGMYYSLRLLDKKRLEVKMYNSIKIVSNSNHLINIVKSSKIIVLLLCSSFDQ